MKGRSLLALSVLSLALACEGGQQTTGPGAPVDGSKIIQDGAHGGNKDFFFLPPMVPLPLHNPDFQLGKFNNTLRPSLRVDICQLDGLHLHPTLGVPTDQTKCITGPLKKQFPAGSVQLVNLPLRQNGWWTLFGLPADGFYYVLWDTRQSNLDVSKFYRISVFVEGKPDALGVADVDPMANLRQWKYSLTGEVIQLVDDVMLPITFRVEQGALCATGTTCTSASYTNTTPLTLPYDPDLTGSTAGVTIPAGALPTPQNSPSFCAENPCPTTVTVKITKVNTDGVGQSPPTLCHSDIPQLQQFKGCYEFTTIPELGRLNELGDQFMTNVLVAVCYELQGTGDPREKFAQLYQSGPEEPSKFLDDVHEGVLIGGDTQDCTPPVIGSRSSNPLIQFASSGWGAVKGGLGKVFGVKTAYAIDLGLGGLTKGFSRISPVLRVGLQAASPIDVTLGQGQHSANVSARIVAQHFHTETAPGVNTVPVTFTVTGINGTLTPAHTEDLPIAGSVPINTTTELGTAGIAEVVWTLPDQPGTYTMTATGPAIGGPLTFTRTVPPTFTQGLATFDTPDIGANDRQVVNPYTDAATGIVFSADPGIVGISRNLSSGTSVCVAPRLSDGGFGPGDGNQKLGTAPFGSTSIGLSNFPIKATFPTVVPAGTLVSLDVQTGVGSDGIVVELHFLDASGAEVGSSSSTITISPQDVANVEDVRCEGAPGSAKRVKVRFFTTVAQAFKHLVVVGPVGFVFVIDNLRFGAPGSFD